MSTFLLILFYYYYYIKVSNYNSCTLKFVHVYIVKCIIFRQIISAPFINLKEVLKSQHNFLKFPWLKEISRNLKTLLIHNNLTTWADSQFYWNLLKSTHIIWNLIYLTILIRLSQNLTQPSLSCWKNCIRLD